MSIADTSCFLYINKIDINNIRRQCYLLGAIFAVMISVKFFIGNRRMDTSLVYNWENISIKNISISSLTFNGIAFIWRDISLKYNLLKFINLRIK